MTSTNSTTQPTEDEGEKNVLVTVAVQYSWMFLSFMTLVFNVATLLVFIIIRNSHDIKAWYEQLLFIIVADLCVGFSQFFYFMGNEIGFGRNIYVCRVTLTFFISSQVNSTLNIFFFSIRRFVSVRKINKLGTVWTKKKNYIQFAVNIICALADIVHISLQFEDNAEELKKSCKFKAIFGPNEPRALLLPLIITLPCLAGTNILYLLCILILRKTSVILPRTLAAGTSSHDRNRGTSLHQTLANRAISNKAKEKNAVATLAFVLAALDICSAPTVIAAVLLGLKVEVPLAIQRSLLNVNALNSMFNPVIYFLRITALRKLIEEITRTNNRSRS